jgi:hypothetical protein
MPKEAKTAEELNEMVAYAILKIPEIAVDMKLDPNLRMKLYHVQAHARDVSGANWTITDWHKDCPHTALIFELVGSLRDKYDLAE